MDIRLLTVEVRFEQDVVLARGRSRQIASLLGFDLQSQTRIATAVSEISRNAFQYGGGGRVEFIVQGAALVIKVSDKGGGIKDVEAILAGRYTSTTGMGLGIVGAKRLMDKFVIESVASETTATLTKFLPKQTPITSEILQKIAQELAQKTPENLYQEVQQQNQELLRTMEELQGRSSELARLNSQLEDTNRGVVTLYAELDDRAESWQKASEMKTRFLSNMSHEFRTPLNAILSLSQLLLERLDGELNSEQEKQVNFIRTSALGLSELVNDLLDIAKVEAGKVTIRPQQFEVSDLFNALKGILRPILNQSEVNLVFDKPQNLPMYTDEGKVSQILRNLISNALKFTPRGEIRVSALKQERRIVFTVADTGIGIAPKNLELIFEEFVQIENPLQSQFKGTGLGLPLCRQLAQLLGGKIAVESKLEVGSIFTVTLPCVYAEVKEAVSPQTPIKVLIIDDEEISRYLLKELLKSCTIKVTEAINGSEGVIKAILEQPQVIFLDLVMPELSGFEVLEQLKANPTTKHIPIIIHTSKQLEPEERDRLINAKVVAILSKDLDRPDAEAIIRQVLLKAGLPLHL